jgi:hypothetical protein
MAHFVVARRTSAPKPSTNPLLLILWYASQSFESIRKRKITNNFSTNKKFSHYDICIDQDGSKCKAEFARASGSKWMNANV